MWGFLIALAAVILLLGVCFIGCTYCELQKEVERKSQFLPLLVEKSDISDKI